MAEHLLPPGLLALVDAEAVQGGAAGADGLVGRSIPRKQAAVSCKGVQQRQMAVLVKELTGIVLTVDRDQPGAQGAQGGNGDALTVDPAGVASVGQDLPLDQQLVLNPR